MRQLTFALSGKCSRFKMVVATLAGCYFIAPGHYKIVPSRQHEFVTLIGRKILHWGCLGLGPWGGVGDLFCPLVHVDWGIFGQLATRATGHLGFGVFAAKQCLWHGGSLLQGRVAL